MAPASQARAQRDRHRLPAISAEFVCHERMFAPGAGEWVTTVGRVQAQAANAGDSCERVCGRVVWLRPSPHHEHRTDPSFAHNELQTVEVGG